MPVKLKKRRSLLLLYQLRPTKNQLPCCKAIVGWIFQQGVLRKTKSEKQRDGTVWFWVLRF